MTSPRDDGALRILVPVAIQALFLRLAPRLETVAPLVPVFDLNPAIPARIRAGEPYDIALTNPPYVHALIAAGLADGASHRPFGRIPLAIGRSAGAAAPVLTEVPRIVALLRAAAGIAYTGEGTSGRTFLKAAARLDLSDVLVATGMPMAAGRAVAAVAAGESELCVGPLTAIASSPGIAVAAILPDAVGAHIDLSVFLNPSRAAAAVALLDILTGPGLDAELAAAGVERFDPSR